MSYLFISHSSKDHQASDAVKAWLEEIGFEAFFLDHDREQGIKGGLLWERSLYSHLRRCDAVIFLCSAASAASRWCFAELALARSLNRPIVPLTLDTEVEHQLLGDTNYIDFHAGDARERLRGSLEKAGLEPGASFRLPPGRSPFPGLEAFDTEDAAVFFGRDAELRELEAQLQHTLERGSPRFVTVIGPSGCGKSSLVRAGLIPRLARKKSRWLVLDPLIPGRRPITRLARMLSDVFERLGRPRPWRDLRSELTEGGGEALGDLCLDLLQASEDGPESALLFVDQFEELARSRLDAGSEADPTPQDRFLRLLHEAVDSDEVSVVVTLRSEFLTGFLVSPPLAGMMKDPFPLPSIAEERLLEVIERPAKRADVTFEPEDLPYRIVGDTAGGDALPLLAYTLGKLYQARRTSPGSEEGGVITEESYEQLGGVTGALGQTADRVVAALAPEVPLERILRLLLRLTRYDDLEPTRERVAWDRFDAEERAIAREFEDARLLKVDRSGDGETVVEVTHEALLRNWSPLQEAIAQRRDDLRLASELRQAARHWDQAGRGEGYLLRSQRLRRALDWLAAEPARRRELPLVAELLGESERHDRADLGQRADVLARTVLADYPSHPRRAIRLAAAAADAFGATPRLERALHTTLRVSGLRRILRDVSSYDRAHGFSPDGRLLVAGRSENGARVVEVDTGRPVLELPLDEEVPLAAFTPDGRHLLTVTRKSRRVETWDAETGRLVHRFPRTLKATASLFSPDGSLLAIKAPDSLPEIYSGPEENAGPPADPPEDGQLRVYDARSGEVRCVVGKLSALGFSPDNSLLFTQEISQSYEILPGLQVRSPENGEILTCLESPDARWPIVQQIQVAGGRHLLTAFSDEDSILSGFQLLCLWDLDDLSGPRRTLDVAGERAALSPDARRLIVGVEDTSTIRDVSSGAALVRWSHGDKLWGLLFSPAGDRVCARLTNKTVELLRTDTGLSLGLAGPEAGSREAAPRGGPGGRRLEPAADGGVEIVEAAGGEPVATLHGHRAPVLDAGWSPDGKRVATVSEDETLRLWDAESGEPTAVVPLPDPPRTAAFADDGRSLVTTHRDGRGRRWACPSVDELVEQALAEVPRDLTAEERKDFGLPAD